MFQTRIYNPYENMPCVGENPYFRINTEVELVADMAKCFNLYDVSTYLSAKVESTYKEYLLEKSLQPHVFIKKYLEDKLSQKKQKKYERNLQLIQEYIRRFQS